jgi:hypothetical protein
MEVTSTRSPPTVLAISARTVVVATVLILGAAAGAEDGMAVASGDGTGVAAAVQAAPSNASAATGRMISWENQELLPPIMAETESKVLGINKWIKRYIVSILLEKESFPGCLIYSIRVRVCTGGARYRLPALVILDIT